MSDAIRTSGHAAAHTLQAPEIARLCSSAQQPFSFSRPLALLLTPGSWPLEPPSGRQRVPHRTTGMQRCTEVQQCTEMLVCSSSHHYTMLMVSLLQVAHPAAALIQWRMCSRTPMLSAVRAE